MMREYATLSLAGRETLQGRLKGTHSSLQYFFTTMESTILANGCVSALAVIKCQNPVEQLNPP